MPGGRTHLFKKHLLGQHVSGGQSNMAALTFVYSIYISRTRVRDFNAHPQDAFLHAASGQAIGIITFHRHIPARQKHLSTEHGAGLLRHVVEVRSPKGWIKRPRFRFAGLRFTTPVVKNCRRALEQCISHHSVGCNFLMQNTPSSWCQLSITGKVHFQFTVTW